LVQGKQGKRDKLAAAGAPEINGEESGLKAGAQYIAPLQGLVRNIAQPEIAVPQGA
jgi:hypothetical protein